MFPQYQPAPPSQLYPSQVFGYNQPAQQAYQQPVQQVQQQPVQQHVQSGGFTVVSSEDEVIRYPVAPGNLVTFKIENQPVVIEKSMGYSQFDNPHYERYELVKKDMQVQRKPDSVQYVSIEDHEDLANVVSQLNAEISGLKNQLNDLMLKRPGRPKKERDDDAE